MHTILLFAAYLSATTLAIPVVELFGTFEGDSALLNGQGTIQNPAQDFSEPGYVGSAPPSLSGDGTTTNYLQAQVPSQDIFSSGAECPSKKLFCCQGGSGPPGTLISDAEFQGKCKACMSSFYFIIHFPNLVAASLLNLNWGKKHIDDNKYAQGDDRCQSASNGSCCQSEIGAGDVSCPHPPSSPLPTTTKKKQKKRGQPMGNLTTIYLNR